MLSTEGNTPLAAADVPDPEPVFVFGANMLGRHEDGHALLATRFHQAEAGVWRGPTGNAYAVPYRNERNRLLSLAEIARHVAGLRQFAASQPALALRVARFACARGEYLDGEIAPLFARMPANCALPALWLRALDSERPVRLLIFDPAGRLREKVWQALLQRYLALNLPLWGALGVELVSAGGARNIVATDAAARQLKLRHRIVVENSAYYGKQAAVAAEISAVWASTHLLSITDLDETAHPTLIRMASLASREGLVCDQLAAAP
jgi:hypothetical protein